MKLSINSVTIFLLKGIRKVVNLFKIRKDSPHMETSWIYEEYCDKKGQSGNDAILQILENYKGGGLMTSKYEAFARTTLDYMNNGLAVIASKSGGNVEQVNDNITGLLYDTCNAKSLAKTIIRLYDNQELIGELGKNGRKRFISEFTQDIYQQKILNVFQLILNRRNKSL